LAETCLRRGYVNLNMSFHSTTLLPGKSPYVRSEADLDTFLASIEMVLKFAANAGFVFSPLAAALEDM
jgi:hypothetical protein